MLSAKLPLWIGLASLVVVLGVGLSVTNFTAYLGNNPATCNNCHVMDAVYEGWYHSAHRMAATCADCHTPHDFIPKYIVKAESGMNHVFHFTFNLIPEPLRAKPATDRIVQANCIRCHSQAVAEIADGQMGAGRFCFDCHRTVAHGERGISLLPYQDTTP